MGTPMLMASAAITGETITPPTEAKAARRFRFHLLCGDWLNFLKIFRASQIGTPMIMPGTATPAISAMITGAPINVATCHRITFLRLHCFSPQNVQPDGLGDGSSVKNERARKVGSPQIVQIGDFPTAQPAEFRFADRTGHVIL